MYRDARAPVRLQDYQSPEHFVREVRLRFELDADTTLVDAVLRIERNSEVAVSNGLWLDGEELALQSLAIDGRTLDAAEYRLSDEGLRIPEVPDRFELHSRVRIHPARNTALEGLYLSKDLLCTQCEAEGFRKITFFPDRPDVMARFDVTLIGDASRLPVMLSNGNPVDERMLDDGRRLVRWQDPFPKPSYLFALVAGELALVEDSFRTRGGRDILLQLYVEPENRERCDHAMASLKAAMDWDERVYGREYDLDRYMIVAVSHFNMGAMENKGLNVFNAKFVLAAPETATDADYQGIEGVIAHEYFHNWTGNRITCRDWFQLSLKEGLTVFRDQEFSADMGSRGVKRIQDVRMLRARQFPEDAGPMAHPVRPSAYLEINNFYTATVYEKGAEVVRMQANLLGPETFRKATDLYFERHDGQAVTTDDFVRCMEDASGRDLGQFRRWYAQAGTPEVVADGDWDATTGSYTLTLRQSTPPTPGQTEKLPLLIPIAIGLVGPDGSDLPLRLESESDATAGTRVLELTEPEQRFRFVGLAERPVPSLLRGFSAPVKLGFDYSDRELSFLMANDSDGFNRWEAAQTLARRELLAMVADAGRAPSQALIDAFAAALERSHADPALAAEVLSLPGEAYLGDQMERVDVDGIHRARVELQRSLGQALREPLLATLAACRDQGPYRPTAESIGRRALKNACLSYLVRGQDAEGVAAAAAQFDADANMTDVLAALALLIEAGQGEEPLARFYARWRGDALVLDKWFALQAQSSLPGALERVEALLAHADFALDNPNRVRSLIGAYAAGNQVGFHRADGAGYRFLTDRLLELNKLNPQIASRLAYPLTRWRRFDDTRAGLMRAELERLAASAELSKDLTEIVSKSLS